MEYVKLNNEVMMPLEGFGVFQTPDRDEQLRSEERRVGKECRSRWSPYH